MVLRKIISFYKNLVLCSFLSPLLSLAATRAPVLTVANFMKNLRNSFESNYENPEKIFHIVMGNQSADLDSMCGAIARARYLSLHSANSNHVFYPTMNIIRPELELRKDAKKLFKSLRIKKKNIFFINELPLKKLREQGRLRLHLVDHNALAEKQELFADCVTTIVDHHDNKNIRYPNCPESSQQIQTVGSVSSLLAIDFFAYEAEADLSWAELLLAPVVLDTKNLKSETKTTALDIEAHGILIAKLQDFDVAAFHKKLLKARQDVKGFTPEMLLLKDKKEYVDQERRPYIISSIPRGCNRDWSQDPEYLTALGKLMKNSKSHLVSSLEKGDERKVFHVLCGSEQILDGLRAHLRSEEPSLVHVVKEVQTNTEMPAATFELPGDCGRKQLQPIVENFMNSWEDSSE